jgi:uncharacterized protein
MIEFHFMKRLTLTLVLAVCSFLSTLYAQDVTGNWYTAVHVQGTELRLVIHVIKKDSGYASSMDSPDQGAKGIPITKTTFDSSVLRFAIPAASLEYDGTLQGDSIVGTFKQGKTVLPMTFSRTSNVVETKRPQEPLPPYPYYSEEVTIPNTAANVTLAGTLTLPKKEGKYPIVVLVTGSGPQNRDEELEGHKPFLVIADFLTRNGIGVLRYDDRGVGKSTGKFATATTADFATDAESAFNYVRTRPEADLKHIGIIGHSEGGLIAPIVATKSKGVGFIVLLAGPGLPGDQVSLLQNRLLAKANGMSEADIEKNVRLSASLFEVIKKSANQAEMDSSVGHLIRTMLKTDTSFKAPAGMSEDQFVASQVKAISNPWLQYFIRYDPAPTLKKVRCPVLALNGAKDLQVAPNENIAAIKKAMAGNKKLTTMILPNLNHLFQECTTGSSFEYEKIEQTFSPTALKVMLEWLKDRVK